MNNNLALRHARYLNKPIDSTSFESLCQRVFGELYHSPGARLYGRNGQGQSGLDILFHDFRTAPLDKGRGMVFVQCKYTEKQDLGVATITKDVLSARELIEQERGGYEGVYLFIIATNARNDTALHDAMQKLKVEQALPFEIEVHTWDKLCQTILDNDRLWELFNESPDGGTPVQYRSRAKLLNERIANHLALGRLKDAWREDQDRKGSSLPFVPAFQVSQGMLVPNEICYLSPPLRQTLLALYSASADAHSALPFRQYEFDLGKLQSAQSCLDYLRSERIVGQIRALGRSYLFEGETPRFDELLDRFAEVISNVQGSPDCLGALALMLVMESHSPEVQDRGLTMMQQRTEQAKGTQWQHELRIAHAVVRYYYVLRRGWNGLACRYALGDLMKGVPLDAYGHKWGTSFAADVTGVHIAGQDPLAPPHRSGLHAHSLILHLGEYARGHYETIWSNLLAECEIYSTDNQDHNTSRWRCDLSPIQSNLRAVDFQTLAIAANSNSHGQMLDRYALIATQATFERLVGYRAFLRAYLERTKETAGTYFNRLEAVQRLVDSSGIFKCPLDATTNRLWISTVYDNPPLRITDLDRSGRPFNHFSLCPDAYEQKRAWVESWGNDKRWASLQSQYAKRGENFNLTCLLALLLNVPLLTYQHRDAMTAMHMGIASIHPCNDGQPHESPSAV